MKGYGCRDCGVRAGFGDPEEDPDICRWVFVEWAG